tara:strand:+ start:1590 stop:3848 length:2259 start_codon:yes stop_codon:yes gene_type:complete
MTTIQQTLFGGGGGGAGSATRTVSSTTTNLDVKTLFGADYTTNSNKTLIINSGVTVGGTDPMKPAMDVPSGMGGSMNIINYGSILGAGGKGGTRSVNGYSTVACTSNGGGRIITLSDQADLDDIGTRSNSSYPYGRPAACLWDLNGNKIKQWYLPLTNPTVNNSREHRVAIGGNRIFIAIQAVSYSGSPGSGYYYIGEGFHIYDLDGNLQSGGTPIVHGSASVNWCSSVAANSSYVVIGDRGFASNGRVFVYNHSGNHVANWTSTDISSTDNFGNAVDINEANDIVVGAFVKNNGTNNGGASSNTDGAVYYFPNFSNSGQVKIMSDRPITGNVGGYPNYTNTANHFGREVLIGKSTIVVAAPFTRAFADPSPQTGFSTRDLGEVTFYNFSGTRLARKNPETTKTNGYFDGYRFGMCGLAKPNPEPASGDEYFLVSDQANTGYQSFWQNEQHVLMYDSNFNRVGCFGCRNSHSLNLPARDEGKSSICMTGANSAHPRVILAGAMASINHDGGGLMIFEHDQFRLAPNAQPFPANPANPTQAGGKAAFEYPIISPDVNGDVNQAGIITDKYLKFTYNLWGDDGGDAIRCDSPNVGINNQGTIYGGGGGGATGATASTANGGPSTPFNDAAAGSGGSGGDGQGYNLTRTNAPSPPSGIEQGGNGGAYGQQGGHGGGSPYDDPHYVTSYQNYGQVYYSDRVRRGYFKFNHRKTMFLRSAEWTANPTNLGGRAGFISTSTNGNSLNFINQGTTAGRS